MKILHITPNGDGYQEAELLAERVSKSNGMHVIKQEGELFMTGGFLLEDSPEIRAVLNTVPADKQYDFVKMFRTSPYVKMYYQE